MYDLSEARIHGIEDEEQKNLIRFLTGKLHTLAKRVQPMDENVLYVYLALQGIAVQRPGAYDDFIRECAPDRIAVLEYVHCVCSFKKFTENFASEIVRNQDLQNKVNKILVQAREQNTALLRRLTKLFGLPAE